MEDAVSLLVYHFCSLTLLFSGKQNPSPIKSRQKTSHNTSKVLGTSSLQIPLWEDPGQRNRDEISPTSRFSQVGKKHSVCWDSITCHFLPLCFLHQRASSSAQREPLNAEVHEHLAFLFWRYDHEWRSSPGPPHEHLGVVGVGPAQGVGRNGLLVVEDVRLLLVGSTHQ